MIGKHYKSGLAIFVSLAIIMSGSFCLHILVMTALAASPAQPTVNSVTPGNMAEMSAISSMSAMGTADSCCQNCPTSPDQSVNLKSGVSMLNCCAGQTIQQTITSANPDLFSHAIVFLSMAFPAETASNPVGQHYYQTVILSPPQTVALRSIVKLE